MKKEQKQKRTKLVPVKIKTHKDKNGGHYHVIMDDVDDKHVSVGLSTKKTKGKNGGKNYAMEKSPLDDGKVSYMRRQGTVDSKKNYRSEKKGTMTPNDYQQAQTYGDRAKQKYLREKEHKKSNDRANAKKHKP